MTIIDSISGDTITGRIGRFVVTSSRPGEAHEGTPGVIEGELRGAATGRGERALVAAIRAAAAHNADRTNGFVRMVSLYDVGQRTWWPVHLTREAVEA